MVIKEIIVYRVGYAAQHNKFDIFYEPEGEEFGPIKTVDTKTEVNEYLVKHSTGDEEGKFYFKKRIEPEPVGFCLHSVKLQVQSILNAVNAEEYKILLTGKGNFRDAVPYYKDNRDREDRPIHYDAIREYLIKQWGAKIVNGREADDAMSILQWRDWEKHDGLYLLDKEEEMQDVCNTIICTIDKDLRMVPGWHYNFVKGEFEFVDRLNGLRWFYTQMLQGDTADNIPGFTKLTGKRVSKWAPVLEGLYEQEDEKGMWLYVWHFFLSAFIEMDQEVKSGYSSLEIMDGLKKTLTETGRLLWMQTSKEDMWEPPV